MTKIAACLIVKNSAATIEDCLNVIRPHVDEINVYDTGSTDDTLDILEKLNEREWIYATADGQIHTEMPDADDTAKQAIPLAPIRVEQGEWRDDFSWARARSFEMCSDDVDWILWLDDDDEIVGAQMLRSLAQSAAPNLDGYVFLYDYARDEHGNNLCQLWRERLIRRDAGYTWRNPIHEVLIPPDGRPAQLGQVTPELVRYVHHRPADRYDPGRNLTILRAELAKAEADGVPPPPRTLAYLGTELMTKGEWAEAALFLDAYLEREDTPWSDERMQVHHKLAHCQRMLGHPLASVETEMLALRERDDWAETHVGLCESFAALGRWDRVERWARQALELGMPKSAMILNPLEFTMVPMLRIAEACALSGRYDEAEEWCRKAAAAAPGQPYPNDRAQAFRQMRQEGETVKAVLHLREILVRFDENEKAYRLMEAVPYIVAEHPAIVAARADQRAMVKHLTSPDEYRRWYEDEPKDSTVTDDLIPMVGDALGRVGALHEGLKDQERQLGRKPRLLDLGCNDWWMGEFFARQGIRCDGVELNKRSFDKAIERKDRFGRDATIVQGDLHDAFELLFVESGVGTRAAPQPYDAISMFEVFEHVPDTEKALDVMESLLAPGGRIYVSTPNGAFENGNIDAWHVVQPKGHLRALPLHELADQILRRGDIEDMQETNGDRVGFVSYTPRRKHGTVIFYAAGSWEEWSPASLRNGGIGGSETALVQVATRLALDGWHVKVYSGASPGLYGGVLYRPHAAWDPSEECDLLVVSRAPHAFDRPIAARQTALWCHDHSYPEALTPDRVERIDTVVVLSEWQRERFERLYPYTTEKLQIIRNGISLHQLDPDAAPRYADATRGFDDRAPVAVYSSSADRGLDVLLKVWPEIRERAPGSELHIYYGFNTLDAVGRVSPQLLAYKQAVLELAQQAGGEDGGVFFKGRVGQDTLAAAMMGARVLAYPTAFLETSCITAMEAQAAGLPAVTSELGALAETVGDHGVLIGWGPDETEPCNQAGEYQDRFVDEVVAMLTDRDCWEHWHTAALRDVDELDWQQRIPQWAGLAAQLASSHRRD